MGDRETLRLPRLADRRGAGPDLVVLGAGDAHPGEVALDVRGENGYAVRGELLGQQLQGLGLAGAGRTGHESVPVEHAERDLDVDVGQVRRVEHQAAELQRRAGERVSGGDGCGDGVVGHG